MAATGMPPKDLAKHLQVGVHTIRAHIEAIRKKLGLRAYCELTAWSAGRNLDAAQARIVDLQQQVKALEADRERLDWLDRMNAALNKRHGTTYRWELILSPNVVRLMNDRQAIDLNDTARDGAESCRAAIDAARQRTA